MSHSLSTAITYFSEIPGAPQAVGPYSIATLGGGLVFLSGQVPINPETKELVTGSIEAQAEQVLQNLWTVLAHAGLTFSDVLKTTIFLTDLSHFKAVNGVYESYLKDARPARSTIQVAALPLGAQVEIEMTALAKKA